MKKSWLRIALLLFVNVLALMLARQKLVNAATLNDLQTISPLEMESGLIDQLTNPVVSKPVQPVDTRELGPATAPQALASGDGEARESSLPLPGLARSGGAAQTIDPLVQTQQGQVAMPAPETNWEGTPASGVFPPDTDGQVGPNHYVQIVNAGGEGAWIRVWDKSGVQLYDFGFNSMYPSFGAGSRCHQYGYGDPVVFYDQMADRWLLTQFTYPPSGPYNECIAVSKTGVPTSDPNDWYLYEFTVHDTKFNDYPKFGVWPDGYYMTANQFVGGSFFAGAGAWVFDRSAMLTGSPTSFIYFDLSDYGGILPSNLMGSTLPPDGAPNYLMGVDMDWDEFGTDMMHIFEFHTDWTTPANSTLTLVKDLAVAPFDWNFTNAGADVPQPITSQGLDGLGDRLMMHLWYRNFGDHESFVVNHTVDVGDDRHGIRWYEIRDATVNTTLAEATIHQQGTYAPDDGHHRWMGSIAMDRTGNIALGYSISSSSLYPSIRYVGRLATDPLGMLLQGETSIISGAGYQYGSDRFRRGRWGDYSAMSVDPLDDCTFWYTQEYIQFNTWSSWRTRVASFRFPNCTSQPSGGLSGTVTEAGTGNPLAGVNIQVSNGLTVTASTTSQASGAYNLTLPASTYTVTASYFGYLPQSVSAVSVVSGTVTTQDFALVPAALAQVDGVVRDSLAGWPLYASLTVDDTALDSIWSNPQSGYYSLTLPVGSAYTFSVDAFVDGYLPLQQGIGVLSGDTTQDFDLQADLAACSAPGYTSTGGCAPESGGLLVGHVYDANLGQALNDASLTSQSGQQATSVATPGDPNIGDGFFVIFSPAGTQVFTASQTGGYQPDTASLGITLTSVVTHSFNLPAGWLVNNPPTVEANVVYPNQLTLPVTLTNQGSAAVSFELKERDQGWSLLCPVTYQTVSIPGTIYTLNDHDIQRFHRRPPYVRENIDIVVPQSLPTADSIEVLLLTPDHAVGGDISLISATLSAYPDLIVTLWDATLGDPDGSALAPYDVVIVGNDYTWTSAGMGAQGVGDALADYIDAGGSVIDSLFVHDYLGWELSGRYVSEGYSPFTPSTMDFGMMPYYLGTLYQPSHPILSGVTSIEDNATIGISHQDVGLSPGSLRLVDWDDGQVFVAVKERVVGVNQLWFHGSNWSGDVGVLMVNAIRYLGEHDVGWLTQSPLSGVLPITNQQVISVTLNSADASSGHRGVFKADLMVHNDSPYGSLSIPVVMTVTVPFEEYLPWFGGG